MSDEQSRAIFERTVAMLKPAFERLVSDPDFRERFEATPLMVLDEMGVELDEATRGELEGSRFSDFWAARRAAVEGREAQGPVQTRDLPPPDGELADEELEHVAGGLGRVLGKGPVPSYAPPYVPVGPVVSGDFGPEQVLARKGKLDLK